jgi:hypothetical protein
MKEQYNILHYLTSFQPKRIILYCNLLSTLKRNNTTLLNTILYCIALHYTALQLRHYSNHLIALHHCRYTILHETPHTIFHSDTLNNNNLV